MSYKPTYSSILSGKYLRIHETSGCLGRRVALAGVLTSPTALRL
jgi:hypothetical protein